jgi:hypothetical protein
LYNVYIIGAGFFVILCNLIKYLDLLSISFVFSFSTTSASKGKKRILYASVSEKINVSGGIRNKNNKTTITLIKKNTKKVR